MHDFDSAVVVFDLMIRRHYLYGLRVRYIRIIVVLQDVFTKKDLNFRK